MGWLTFLERTGASVSTPATGKVALFVDSADGLPKYKDDAGTVTSLQGAPGEGVPPGGTAGQRLAKIDGTDYNTEWVTASGATDWGDIGGTLSDQTDLQAALNAKAANAYSIVTEASAFTADPGTHDGLSRYVRAGGDVTFDNAEPYTAGMAFNIRATAAIELIEDGVTLTPPAGGTLELDADMAVQVVMTSSTAGDVIGQTVPA